MPVVPPPTSTTEMIGTQIQCNLPTHLFPKHLLFEIDGSGYDYHGYHAMDFSTVDVRYESDDFTYQDRKSTRLNSSHT